MTARNEDPNYLVWLRQLQARVSQLESGAGTKQNNIRLGDWVCEVDDDGCVVATNIKSGNQTVLCDGGGLFEIMWSTPGDIDSDTLAQLILPSPVWYPHASIQFIEGCLFLGTNDMTAFGTVQADFLKNGSIFVTAPITGVSTLKSVVGTSTSATTDDEISVQIAYDDEAFPIGNRLTALLRYQYV